jgi:dTDP-4-amino-4,6-dideoxy-D-galactose acyltransferase
VRGGRLSRETLEAIESWVAREGVECLYLLADAADPLTATLAEESGFRLVDVRVTLERRGGGTATPPRGDPPMTAIRVRPATAADLPALRGLAAASHRDSRFYHDPHFDRGRCDELYATWIENSCADPAGIVMVAEIAGAGMVAGYVTAALAPGGGGEGRIGLFAVGAAAQGQGVGGRLIAAACDWFAVRGADPVSVVTQGRNVRAQRIYQRFGMLTRSVELWFHRWWPAEPPAAPDARSAAASSAAPPPPATRSRR